MVVPTYVGHVPHAPPRSGRQQKPSGQRPWHEVARLAAVQVPPAWMQRAKSKVRTEAPVASTSSVQYTIIGLEHVVLTFPV